ncbi:hypothetical protein [Pontibacter cellulosilyticus]|uniref:Cardiolipin synthase N-terminal domain-containing protein n=1 Tax=Pontibacter cellulosilyticus TaxID=1720253 RepID=A0A923SH74_9BACT|nr:hypothetical protein [Pontibacter cellulosilyticus]MBC5991252.1 hypothetical protein [Pontibacter cellulosilyticus]
MEDFAVGLGVFGLIIGLIVLVIYLWSIVWAYKDAERRGKPGWLVAIVVAFLAWPIGLLLWLLVRPNDRTTYNP